MRKWGGTAFWPPIRLVVSPRRESKSASEGECKESRADDPLDSFRSHFHFRVAHLDGLPPFVGGAIGYASYDVVRYVENLPNAPEDDRGLPDLDFAFFHTLCVFDHVEKTITVVSLADCREVDTDDDVDAAYRQASEQVNSTIEKLTAENIEISIPVEVREVR